MSNHTKGHEHKLDIVCLQCVINKYDQYDKLLAFVKEIIQVGKTNCWTCGAWEYDDAVKLLKQIGELE